MISHRSSNSRAPRADLSRHSIGAGDNGDEDQYRKLAQEIAAGSPTGIWSSYVITSLTIAFDDCAREKSKEWAILAGRSEGLNTAVPERKTPSMMCDKAIDFPATANLV